MDDLYYNTYIDKDKLELDNILKTNNIKTTISSDSINHNLNNSCKTNNIVLSNQSRDGLLAFKLNKETENRKAEDTKLWDAIQGAGSIVAETVQRKQADEVLQSQINNNNKIISLQTETGVLNSYDLSILNLYPSAKISYNNYIYYYSRKINNILKYFSKKLIILNNKNVDTTIEIDVNAITGEYYPITIYNLYDHEMNNDIHVNLKEKAIWNNKMNGDVTVNSEEVFILTKDTQ